MKNKHLLFAMALPALFAACADDNFTSQSNPSNAQGEFITLPANFALVQDNENAQTKGAWNTNSDLTGSFYWMPELVDETNSIYAPDRIGLSWTGVSLKEDGTVDPVGSALTSYSDRVFTNYKFEHFAWRIVGEELKADPCTPNKWQSGAELLQNEYFTADWKRQTSQSLPPYIEKKNLKDGDIDLRTGLFNTDNSTVYAGQYIVYAPYDAENVSNYIIASSKNVYDGAYLYGDNGSETATGGKVWEYNDIFVYGKTEVGGGDQLTTFTTKNLHGYVSLALKGVGNIKKVILYDAKGRLLTKVGLSAKGIYEGKEGKDLYLAAGVAARETTKTITVEMEKRGTTGSETYPTLKSDANSRVLIPVLPTESALDNVEIILVNDEDKAFRTTISSLSITANEPTGVTINNVNFDNAGVLVTDELALRVATGNQTNKDKVEDGFTPDTESNATMKTVELLGDIELTTTLAIRGNYTLNGGRIIIPGNNGQKVTGYGNNAELRMVVHNGQTSTKANPVINSEILVKAAGCCMNYGGSLIVGNATIKGNVTTENQASYADSEDYEDDLSSDKGKHGMVKFNVTGATTTFAGKLVNNGRLDFGRSDRGASNTGTVARANVNVENGGSIVNNNQMTIFRYVVNNQTNTQYSPYVFVGTDGELSNNGVFTIEGALLHQGSGKNSGIIYDRVGSTVSGDLIDYNTANAQYVCDVNDPGQRFRDAVEGKGKPTTTVRFVEKDGVTYDFETVDETLKTTIKKYVVAVEPNAESGHAITMKGNIDLSGKDIEVESGRLTFGKYTVGSQSVVSQLKASNIVVDAEGSLVMQDVEANIASNVTVSGELFARSGEFNIGSRENKGTLTINTWKGVTQNENVYQYGFMQCALNSVTTVYGDIINSGKVDVIEAAATEGDIAAYLYYTGTVTGNSTNWIHGGATKMN